MNSTEISQRWYWIFGVSLVVLTILGWFISPIDRTTSRPLLLIPEVKAVHDYQVKARSWISQFQLLDAEISGLLIGSSGDLFSQSRQATSR